MLPFEAHLESMLTVDFRQVVGKLESRRDFIGRQECIAAERLQSAKAKCRQPAVFRVLGDAEYAKTSWDVT